MDSLRVAFDQGMFVGKIVTNWCQKCRKWRLEYVSIERLKAPQKDEKFKCATCKEFVPLNTDDEHTVLSNVTKVSQS